MKIKEKHFFYPSKSNKHSQDIDNKGNSTSQFTKDPKFTSLIFPNHKTPNPKFPIQILKNNAQKPNTNQNLKQAKKTHKQTFVTAFPEKRSDNLPGGIVRFNQQNPENHSGKKPLPPHNPTAHLLLLHLTLHASSSCLTAHHNLTHQKP